MKTTSRALLFLVFLFVVQSNAISDERLSSVPRHLIGLWVEQLSRGDYEDGCQPSRLVVRANALTTASKFCPMLGDEDRSQSTYVIREVIVDRAWLGNGITYGLIGMHRGSGINSTWVFRTREGSLESYVYLTDPSESFERSMGDFRKQR